LGKEGLKKMKKFILITLMFLILSTIPIKSNASEPTPPGYVVGSGVATLFYLPMKTSVCLLAAITGGLSMIGTAPAGNEEVSLRIIKRGALGDWTILPKHLQGLETPKIMGYS
jgi:hypothetical protein